MSRTTIVAARRAYTVNLDDPRRRGDLHQSIVIAQLVDELTGRPVHGAVRVSTDLSAAHTKTARDGVGGVVGVPSRLFSDLDGSQYRLDIHFAVDGFLPLLLPDVLVPQQPAFPGTFADVDLGSLPLRRSPVVVAARTVQLDSQNREVALPFATVEVSGIWRTIDDLSGAPVPPNLVAIRPALSARRPQPGTTLEPVTMTQVLEPERRLVRAAEPGMATVEVSRTGGLVIGSKVALDLTDADRVEYIEVADIVGPSDPESPTSLILAFPAQHIHREGATVQEVTPAGLGPLTANLAEEGLPGDPTLFVTSVAPFGVGPVVRITGGPAPDEYAVATVYSVITDGEGYGWLPPITRVAAVEVVASAPGPLAAPPAPFTPRYGVFENPLHLVLE